jgi:hypothetical protein
MVTKKLLSRCFFAGSLAVAAAVVVMPASEANTQWLLPPGCYDGDRQECASGPCGDFTCKFYWK